MKQSLYGICTSVLLASVVMPASANNLINISTRAVAGQGDEKVIAGFTIDGSESKKMIIGAGGPALTAAGVPNVLADPKITLFGSDGVVIATNSNWANDSEVAATTFASLLDASIEPAMVLTLQPGAYTVVVEGEDGGVGNSLVFAQTYSSVITNPPADSIVGNWVGTKTIEVNGNFCTSTVTLTLNSNGTGSASGVYVSGAIPNVDCEDQLTFSVGGEGSYSYDAPFLSFGEGEVLFTVLDATTLTIATSKPSESSTQNELEVYTRQ